MNVYEEVRRLENVVYVYEGKLCRILVAPTCDVAMATQKQLHFNCMLKQASEGMLINDCDVSIALYKTALNLISDDPYSETYDLSELDICVIEYSLYKCYCVNKKNFSDAIDEYVPLVVTYGRQFPFLYYGLATLCLKHHSYRQAESVINNGLDAVASLKEGCSFKANWPGTDIEIPESDPEYLLQKLHLLKEECCSMQKLILVQENEEEGAYSDECYQSDSSSNHGENENDSRISLTEDVSHTELRNARNGIPSFDADLSDHVNLFYPAGSSSLAEIDQLDDDITMTEMVAINYDNDPEEGVLPKSNLKVDVPEFVPRASVSDYIGNMLKEKTVALAANPAVLLTFPESKSRCPTSSQLHKMCQTECVRSVNKDIQVKVKSVNAVTQTRSLEGGKENLKHKSCLEQITELKSELGKFINESHQQHQQIENLQTSLLSQKENAIQMERQHLLSEQKSIIELAKLEVRVEGFQDIVRSLKLKNKEQDQKIKMLQGLLSECYTRNYAREKQQIVSHVNRCCLMISSLNSAVRFLTPMSHPTLEECQRQICHWEDELENSKETLRSFNCSWQRVSADLIKGIFSPFPDAPDLPIQLIELRDILHDNYVAVVQTLIREQQLHQQQKQHFQQQYSLMCNNYSRIPTGVTLHAAPYYNQQQSYRQRTYIKQVETLKPNDETCLKSARDSNSGGISKLDYQMAAQNSTNQSQLLALLPIICDKVVAPSVSTVGKYPPGAVQGHPNRNFDIKGTDTPAVHDQPTEKLASPRHEDANVIIEVEGNTASQPFTTRKNSQLDNSKIKELETEQMQENKKQELKTDPKPENKKQESDRSQSISFVVQKVLDSHLHSKQTDKNSSSETTEHEQHQTEEPTNLASLNNGMVSASGQDGQNADSNHSLTTSKQLKTADEAEPFCDSIPKGSKEDLGKLQAAIKEMKIDWVKAFDSQRLQPPADLFVQDMQSDAAPAIANGSSTLAQTRDSTDKQTACPAEQQAPSCSRNNALDDHTEGEFTNLNELVKKPSKLSFSIQSKGRSNFKNLVAYVTSKIPGASEEEVSCIIKSVRQSLGKLSGMTRESIVDLVRAELGGKADGTENKAAWKVVKFDLPPWDNDNADTKCTICIEAYGNDNLVTKLRCQHKFHTECIRKWFANNSICPVCRIHTVFDEDFPPLVGQT